MLAVMSILSAASQAQGPAIQVQGLEKSYKELRVLRGVDFDVARGSIFALLGSNGAGKTTVVKILSTLLKADAGTARVNGFDVAAQGAGVRMVSSPLDALRLARGHPDREVVFYAIGFETTAPSTALTLQRARLDGAANFWVFCNHVPIAPPVRAIVREHLSLRDASGHDSHCHRHRRVVVV